MSSILKPYPAYRASGLPWLGHVPEHWDVRRNGRLFSERNQTGFEDLPILEVSLRTGVRVRDMENGARKQQMKDRSKYKYAAKGDISYNMMRMWQGAVGVAPVDGLISPAYVVARPFDEVETRYYTYLFRTDAYMREVNKFSRGIVSDRNRLYWDEFKQMPSAFPPTDEQIRIADFLDAHSRLTARLIRNKRRLIGLLNEQKQAVINQAVTRGLDPNAPMKPTGIDWMPEVPARWGLPKFKFFARFLSGGTPPMAEGKYWTDDIPWVSPKDMKVARIASAQMSVSKKAIEDGHTPLLKPGNLMMVVRSGILRRSIPVAICDAPVTINQDIKGIVLDENVVSPSYLQLLVTGLEGSLLLAWRKQGATVESLEYQFFANSYLPLPDIHEQNEIEIRCKEETAVFDKAIEKAQSEISLVREYRERLIADVVTGKLDVRGIEITALPDKPLDDDLEEIEEELDTDTEDSLEGADAED
ncbi:restriction endonuclease subunit S [Thalassospira marina]|uniref:Restriction endonuclease subunit S n=1 Tax=Thalassospira marina TaxID=2048283 RepID=A0ABM6QB93_9PROT|nr:restriction endonuclease subunit S [Thalassospira marina]AUG53491.1 restriction endonuclease subunit S [Thalassospira marina]